ncbi:hypothetical protein M9H77_30489 [Catharanthus roseus]|uniref:Uncharacterized protein n=1 Tax=Catharanthus roseus TaxID=4058 RepID=A0ACB9ZYQ1_CATRO|nr:hypothetical protein M9H77_30489 [Catharanthus roseus]
MLDMLLGNKGLYFFTDKNEEYDIPSLIDINVVGFPPFGITCNINSPSLNASVFAHSHSPTHVSLANTVEYPTRLIKNPSKLKQQVRQMGSSTPLVPKEPLTSIVNKIAAFLSLKRRLPELASQMALKDSSPSGRSIGRLVQERIDFWKETGTLPISTGKRLRGIGQGYCAFEAYCWLIWYDCNKHYFEGRCSCGPLLPPKPSTMLLNMQVSMITFLNYAPRYWDPGT